MSVTKKKKIIAYITNITIEIIVVQKMDNTDILKYGIN